MTELTKSTFSIKLFYKIIVRNAQQKEEQMMELAPLALECAAFVSLINHYTYSMSAVCNNFLKYFFLCFPCVTKRVWPSRPP